MKIIVLGGGISGLSAAWQLAKEAPDASIVILEGANRLGGAIETVRAEGVFFEKGPRTFVASRSAALRALIEEVGLKDEIIASDPAAAKRYLWHRGKLRSIRSFLPMALPALIREMFVSKKECGDESIYDFAARRFSPKIASTLFDPMTLGIFSGDIRTLSLRSCFPALHQWEQSKGSIVRGLLSRLGKGSGQKGLFTLRRGMGSLIEALANQLRAEIVLNTSVEEIRQDGVIAAGRFWPADRIVSALPGPVIGKLTGAWPNFPAASLWVVSFAFPPAVLQRSGFGYLVPTQEHEPVLGAIWDSAIFPEQTQAGETRITVMVRPQGDAHWAEQAALDALRRHLGISARPFIISAYLAEEAIPQFEVGYAKKLARFTEEVKTMWPRLSLVGNYVEGPAVDACVRSSMRLRV